MNKEKLKALFEASRDKYADARRMGTTYQTITNVIYRGADIKASTLERIAHFYNVPVGYFFDEAEADSKTASQAEIERLKAQMEGLREALSLLRNSS